jgi:hypothetical protein
VDATSFKATSIRRFIGEISLFVARFKIVPHKNSKCTNAEQKRAPDNYYRSTVRNIPSIRCANFVVSGNKFLWLEVFLAATALVQDSERRVDLWVEVFLIGETAIASVIAVSVGEIAQGYSGQDFGDFSRTAVLVLDSLGDGGADMRFERVKRPLFVLRAVHTRGSMSGNSVAPDKYNL